MVAKSLLALIALACTPAQRAERGPPALSYWESLAGLNAEGAMETARTGDERRFAAAVRDIMAGEIARAGEAFDTLRRQSSDSIVASASRVMYVAVLQYREQWSELAALSPRDGEPGGERDDRASIHRWSRAFRDLPARTFAFGARTAAIPMTVSAVGTPRVRVQIGPRVFNFWLDTGSSMTMLASDVAISLGIAPLVRDTLQVLTSTGRIDARPGVIPELRLGQLVIRNVPAMIVDETIMQMRESPTPGLARPLKIDGIIGFDIIRLLDIEVDYARQRLTLRDPARSRRATDRNMYWVGLPIVKLVSSGGLPLHFALDTGAQLTFVTESLLERLKLQVSRIENRRVGGLGGEISMRAPILRDLRLRLRGHPIVLRDAVVRAPVYQVLAALDGVLGGDIWSVGVIRIDATNGVFAVDFPESN